ncbi:hypothetical protein Q7380_11760 [Glaesserella parasuis]|uniref:hypothetical protein n=1 Tax=Glaesserella parasuis TaxID=738 RepID=UPI001319DC55|nr:hypothetical protein [Glaesserella parasuis]MDO9810934.1 hypothetical protein [Glaesserella parasuis]MDO9899121.1 hypothetical protein [Glaesserella parasuis]MDO9927397.1 hypothetical protein [Glaesserella parasuis]MDO9931852.1 hypothetical protein [Glaesserella parasuis]MDP0021040.1 hypothetical protein [Glaesserella parasuis]
MGVQKNIMNNIYSDMPEKDVNQTLTLLRSLFSYVYAYYNENGLQSLIDITDPSLDDLLNILTEIDHVLPASNLNAKQAVLLAFGLIRCLQSANIDDDSFRAQIKSIINTNIYHQE